MLLKGRFEILKGYENNHVTIGFGSYGQVKLARDLQTTNIVAVKVINKIAKNEVLMHYGLSHPKIIKLIDVHIDTQREITYMILEYADGGTLFEKIKMESISKRDIKRYFRDVCEAMTYLHNQNIMHRDIKVTLHGFSLRTYFQAKLCDFGFAAILGERKTLCGTYEYMSPQMIQNRPYDYKIDIWALGILLFEMIAGNAPFKGDKPEDVLEQMKTKIYFCERFELQDINLVKMILRVTPNKRPTIQEILEHPFFKDDDEKELTVHSTTNTEDSKAKIASLQYLSESCNPKKMAELQKILEKQHQKQTYPPFNSAKTQHKIGTGITVPAQNKDKAYSPMHGNKPTTSFPPNANLNGFYRPPQQFTPNIANNKTFSGALNAAKSPINQPEHNPNTSSQSINFLNTQKNTFGYGRFS